MKDIGFARALLTGKPMYASLHTADPGRTGANEVAAGGYRRSLINDGTVKFDDMPAVTVTHVGIWETMYNSGFCHALALSSSKTTLKRDTIQAGLPLLDEVTLHAARIFSLGSEEMLTEYYEGRLTKDRPCPYCGMLNPPDAVECGAGRWNGCGAPLRKQ